MSGNSVGLYGSTATANVAGGNVTGLYQQSQSVEVDNGYNDADVQAFLESYTGNIQCGNIDVLQAATVNAIFTDGYYYANGTPIDIGINSYGNANVAAFLPTYTGNLAGGNLTLTSSAFVGNSVTITNHLTTGGMITAGSDIQAAGNIRTTGASGNITGADYIQSNFFVGDGSLLTNVAGTGYGNANVANYLASGTNSSNIVTTGNVSGTYILGNISQASGFPEVYGNANVANFLANFGSNTIVTTGNIDAGNVNAAHLATTGNVTVGGTLLSDDITSSGVTVYGDQVITGNLTVQGNTTTINSNVIVTNDKTITVANNQSTSANVDGAGLEAGNPAIATWLYNALTDSWQSNVGVTPKSNVTLNLGGSSNRWSTVYSATGDFTGNVSVAYISGNGSLLSSLTGANVSGTVANATHATVADSANSVSGSNVVGAVANATYATSAGTADSASLATYVTGNAQANITSVGTLTSLDVTGNVTGGNLITTTNIVIPTNGKILGDFSTAAASGRTIFQTTNTGTSAPTQLTAIPGANNTATNRAGMYNYQVSDIGNSAFGGMQMTATDFRITTGRNGTGNLMPILFATNNGTTNAVRVTIDINGNVGMGNTAPLDPLSVTGTAYVSGNITTAGILTDGYYYANGTPVSFGGTYGDSNVVTLLASFGSNTVSTTGNVTAGNFIGSGASLSSITGANVVGAVANATYAISAGSATTATSATTAGTVTTAAQPNITSVGTLSSLSVTGNITSSANISGVYILGNGSQLTGLTTANSFSTIDANGTSIVADSSSDTLTLVAGTNITITGNATSDTITISSTAAGGDSFNPFLLMGA